jgi:ankyrin repeat protein
MKSNIDLINAAKNGNFEEVAKLIDTNFNKDQAASVNYQEPKTGASALHYAVKNGNMALVNLLLKNYADVRLQDSRGQNPLHIACLRGDLEVYKLIVQRCPQVKNAIDKNK